MNRSPPRGFWPLLLLPTLAFAPALLAAQGHAPQAPAPVPAVPACKAPAGGPTYLLPSQVDLVALLPPPPAENSAAEQQDLQAVLDAQHAAHADGTLAHALADALPSCSRFADVLGPALTAKSDAQALAFLDRAAHEGAAILAPAKAYWKRARPFALSDRVERLGDMAPDWEPATPAIAPAAPVADTPAPDQPAGAADAADNSTGGCMPGESPMSVASADASSTERRGRKRHASNQARSSATARSRRKDEQDNAEKAKAAEELAHSSFPSGHATYGTVCAILLADMVPEKRAQLFARNRDFGHSRLVLGAHFPTDLAAGRIAGTVAATLLMQNARFQRDYAEARMSLRSALGLPADPPEPPSGAARAAFAPPPPKVAGPAAASGP